MENMALWDKLRTPPPSALKKIQGGRLKGMSDISPQWRYEIMTEVFGACGMGWSFVIDKLWTEPGSDGQVFAFAQVSVMYKEGEKWSEGIQGVGGSMLIAKEKSGLHCSDEAFKMATTDAIGTALKMIGVAADVYAGKCDSKYQKPNPPAQKPKPKQDDFKTMFGKLPKMTDQEASAMSGVWLITKDLKPEHSTEPMFKYETCVKLHEKMGHWPITEQEQEEAIEFLDKEYKNE